MNDSVTKSKFDNLYGCRESLVDGIKRATDVMIAGKVAVVAGYGDVGKGCAQALQRAVGPGLGDRNRPDLRARRPPWKATSVVTMDYAAEQGRHLRHLPPATTTSSRTTTWHRMKDQAIVCNIGHFDNEIDIALGGRLPVGRDQAAGRPRDLPGRQEDHSCLAKGRLVNLGCATGHPSFVMS